MKQILTQGGKCKIVACTEAVHWGVQRMFRGCCRQCVDYEGYDEGELTHQAVPGRQRDHSQYSSGCCAHCGSPAGSHLQTPPQTCPLNLHTDTDAQTHTDAPIQNAVTHHNSILIQVIYNASANLTQIKSTFFPMQIHLCWGILDRILSHLLSPRFGEGRTKQL